MRGRVELVGSDLTGTARSLGSSPRGGGEPGLRTGSAPRSGFRFSTRSLAGSPKKVLKLCGGEFWENVGWEDVGLRERLFAMAIVSTTAISEWRLLSRLRYLDGDHSRYKLGRADV